jgi:hypothetical protein
MEKKIRTILEAIRKESFTPDYQAAATDEELLGLLLSRHFKWDGLAILRTAYAALEDSNFHTDNEVIQGLIDKYAKPTAKAGV